MIDFILATLILLIGSVAAFSARWAVRYFGLSSFSQIIYHVKVPLEGTNPDVIVDWLKMCFLPSFIYTLLVLIVFALTNQSAYCFRFAGLMFCLFILYGIWRVGIISYVFYQFKKSNLYEDEFVDAKNIKVENEPKRNLIHIYLESMENTHMDKEHGGNNSTNLIKELTKLAEDNISFSNTEKLGGARQVISTGWTTAGMVASSAGVPINMSINAKKYTGKNKFMPGITTISEILEKDGYNQEFICGSDVKFGGRASFYEDHAKVNLYDWNSAKDNGDVPSDYRAFWGFEDTKLFDIAKKRVLKLAKQDEPFSLTLLTIDTHHPYGYTCDKCENEYDQKMANILACQSKQVYEFIEWLKQQDFYDSTTIVLCGDHLSMAAEFIEKNYDSKYERTTYNCFINSVNKTNNIKNRQFTTFDLFPTILSSMGIKIPGDKLGLGTNLFSQYPTLMEQIGYSNLNKEVSKRNTYYNKYIL